MGGTRQRADAPPLPPNECKVGGPHYFEKIDPRDEKQLGMSGLHCVECGAAPREGE